MENSPFFKVTWTEVKKALVLGVLMALLVVITEVIAVGDIYGLDWKTLLNLGIIALLTSFASFLQDLLTTRSGRFVGAVKIK